MTGLCLRPTEPEGFLGLWGNPAEVHPLRGEDSNVESVSCPSLAGLWLHSEPSLGTRDLCFSLFSHQTKPKNDSS